MYMQHLPVYSTPTGAQPMSAPQLRPAVAFAEPVQEYEQVITGMTELDCSIGKKLLPRVVKLDSGASLSCVSEKAYARDRAHLLSQGSECELKTPMTLSGFQSAHAQVQLVVKDAVLTIGKVACVHNLLVVPGLVCDYMLGQDFILQYDLCILHSSGSASMLAPREEWKGSSEDHNGTQTIPVRWIGRTVSLKLSS